ncbi:MAG: DinB family protein [Ferruginibacter sp.]
MSKPVKGTYPAHFETYISKVNEDNLRDAFRNQAELVNGFFDAISEEKSGHAYAAGKWTLKELLQHIIDAERVFAYRALCFARKETTSLPGFDENNYADNSFANEREWKSLVDELKAVRKTTEILFDSFNTDTLNHSGIANNNPVTVNAIGFIIVGHLNHHRNIITERYL